MSRGKEVTGIRISYSSSTTFQGCQRKFFYQKVAKEDIDPDVDDDGKALRIGKAFHYVLELCHHHKSLLKPDHYKKSFIENQVDSRGEQGLIVAMVKKYLELHLKSNLGIKGIEVMIGDEKNFIGYIDVILADKNGNWWIVDLKTAARLQASLLSRLSRDPQLNVYAKFVKEVARKCELDVEKFQGVRYRVTTKATIKCGQKETLKEFAKRCYDRIESYDIAIGKKDLIPDEVWENFMRMLKEMRALEGKNEEDVPQNFGHCESYFKPCHYWSRCYGKTFTENAEQYEIFDTDNIPDLTVEESADNDLDFF